MSRASSVPVVGPKLKLETIIGLTTLSNSSLTASSQGDIYYAAGCCVVRYCPEDNKQKMFYTVSKAVSSVNISADGKCLAIGERGHMPNCVIFDVVSAEKKVTLSGHKYGVGCVAFSPDGQYVVTVGFKYDKQLILWDWKLQQKLCVHKIGNKVNAISFHSSGDCFVTSGDKHLKWWNFVNNERDEIDLKGKPATIYEGYYNIATASFTDVCFGYAEYKSNVYCTTSTGLLCLFNESKTIDKWVQIDSPVAYCLTLFCAPGIKGLLVAGCADGVVRAFSPDTLDYITTLPLPHPVSPTSDELSYGACYAMCKVLMKHNITSPPKLATIYADKSLLVWDIGDILNVLLFRSFLFHRASIWDIHFIGGSNQFNESGSFEDSEEQHKTTSKGIPSGTFVTCSADNTVRLWNLNSKSQRLSKWRSVLSREILHIIEVDSTEQQGTVNNLQQSVNSFGSISSSNTTDRPPIDLSSGIPDTELPDRPKSINAPRSLAIHPYGHQLVCGDRSGWIRIYDLNTMQLSQSMQAHAAEILTLNFSPPMTKSSDGTWGVNFCYNDSRETISEHQTPLILLASAGRDRLVHIFDASKEHYSPISTLDNHSSSVTVAKFTTDGKRFLSCGGDRTIVFSTVNGPDIVRLRSVQTSHGTINGLAVEPTNKFAVTSGQDKRLNIWNVQNSKHMRAYKSDLIAGELYKSDIDPSGMYVAACSFDKTINLFDFFSGELICQVTGHSESVTGVRFSTDGKYLISVGGEGCIMVWQVSDVLVTAMQDRLMELYSNAQKKQEKAFKKSQLAMQEKESKKLVEKNNSSSVIGNKWIARPEIESGYELFGQKIIPGVSNERNKFTLEITQDTVTSPLNSIINESDINMSLLATENLSKSNEIRSNILATTAEASDHVVMQSELSDGDDDDDDDDDDQLFKNLTLSSFMKGDNNEKYDADFENEDEMALARASTNLDSLEQSAINLDNWIEEILRNEGKIDENVSNSLINNNQSKVESHEAIDDNDKNVSSADGLIVESSVFEKSLSSAFFHNMIVPPIFPSADAQNYANVARIGNPSLEDRGDELLPPVPILHTIDDSTKEKLSREVKQRETAAKVSLMRERLRVMGVLKSVDSNNSKLNFTRSIENTIDNIQDNFTSGEMQIPIENSLMPPPPPSENEQSQSLPNDDGNETSSTVTDDEHEEKAVEQELEVTSNKGPIYNEDDLTRKTSECKNVLNELSRLQKVALASYEELLCIRNSVDIDKRNKFSENFDQSAQDISFTTLSVPSTSSKTVLAVEEADLFISEYRQSFSSLSTANSLYNSLSIPQATSSPSRPLKGNNETRDDLNVSILLEKYSDKLVELISQKVVNKINQDKL